MKKKTSNLTARIMVAMVLGIVAGILMIVLRENLISNGSESVWNTINNLLFADISVEGNEKSIGLFYIVGQLFVRALQLVIIPMVFTSIVLAMVRISDSKKLGRISSKTLGFFLLTTVIGIVLASVVGMMAYYNGMFTQISTNLEKGNGTTGANPLMIVVNAMPNNMALAFTNNGGVLAIVITAVAVGLSINVLGDKVTVLKKLCQEVSDVITVFLNFIVNTFGPVAIFCLLKFVQTNPVRVIDLRNPHTRDA